MSTVGIVYCTVEPCYNMHCYNMQLGIMWLIHGPQLNFTLLGLSKDH